ncbi:hypothetical protein LXL04_009092 [Taraxacum kok-saghyz]
MVIDLWSLLTRRWDMNCSLLSNFAEWTWWLDSCLLTRVFMELKVVGDENRRHVGYERTIRKKRAILRKLQGQGLISKGIKGLEEELRSNQTLRVPYSKVRWCKCDPNKNADSDWEPSEETGSEDTDTSSEDKRTSDSQPSFGLTAGKWRSIGIEDDFGNADFGRVVSGVKQRSWSQWIRGNFPKPDEASQQFWSEQGALGTKSSFGHGEPANAFRSLAGFETE